jgi:N-acetylglucosaminyldiphosphoundecaprenol N-acetyl-beta-D-mannosaminyltransferase
MRRFYFDQLQIDAISIDETVSHVSRLMSLPRSHTHHIVTVNAQFVQTAHDEPRFADAIRRADLSVADGVPLVWASRLLRQPLPGRVNGTDLMVRLCQEAASQGNTVYFLGGLPGAAEAAASVLQRQFPSLMIAGIDCPPFGFNQVPALDKEVCARIEQARPDLVLVALGAPKAEYWIQDHLQLSAKVMIGIGGSFELVAGYKKRAPLLLQKMGCEWLWRLCMEPGRLWKRYLIGNSLFGYLLLKQMLFKDGARVPEST